MLEIRQQYGALRISLLFIGAGLGILMGYFLDQAFDMEEVGYFSMLFIFGGVGLGVSYLIEEKKIKEEIAARGIK
jgi:F0F1-type ATP synthase assembly protein I